MAGLIHIYCGDGKGKTTAAVGLTLRSAGAGNRVVFTQFFKDGSSSEISLLRQIPGISVLHTKTVGGFWKCMTTEQQAQASRDYTELFHIACERAKNMDLLVLDEVISACNHGTVPEEALLDFLKSKPENLEVVLTGRNPSEALLAQADYVTEMKKIKHPFDRGVLARKGIEY